MTQENKEIITILKQDSKALNTLITKVEVLSNEVTHLKNDIGSLRGEINDLRNAQKEIERAVGDGEMAKKLVYGFVGLVLVGFASAVISQFIGK